MCLPAKFDFPGNVDFPKYFDFLQKLLCLNSGTRATDDTFEKMII